MSNETNTIQPLGSRILVKRLASEEKIGSLYIPDQGKELSQKAEVISLGTGGTDPDGKPFHGFTVKVGDIVLIGKYNGTPISAKDDAPLVMFEREVIAIFQD